MNAIEQIYRFFNSFTSGAPFDRSLLTQILADREAYYFSPSRKGATMIAFRIEGEPTDKLKAFGEWWKSAFGVLPYVERRKSGAIFWVWFQLPEDETLKASDYETFVCGLNDAYSVFDNSDDHPRFRRYDVEKPAPYPVPLVGRKGDLEEAYKKLRAAKIKPSMFLGSRGVNFGRSAALFRANASAEDLDGEGKRLFQVSDSPHARIWKVVRHLIYRDMKLPTIGDVETFWRTSGLEKLDNAGGFDVFWQNDVADAIDKLADELDPKAMIEKASKYLIGNWRWLVESKVDSQAVADAKLSFPELEIVLGLITQSVVSERWKGLSNRDGLLSFITQTFIRHGLRIDKHKTIPILKLLSDAGLVCVAAESHKGKSRIYRLGEKHPLFRFVRNETEVTDKKETANAAD